MQVLISETSDKELFSYAHISTRHGFYECMKTLRNFFTTIDGRCFEVLSNNIREMPRDKNNVEVSSLGPFIALKGVDVILRFE